MTRLRINATAIENARAFDRKHGGRTMPDNALAIWGPFKRKKKTVPQRTRWRKPFKPNTLRVKIDSL